METSNSENKLIPFFSNGISFNLAIQGPAETATSLQIICFFDFKKNQHYDGGTLAVNGRFQGEIHEIRQSGIFRGNRFETLLITPGNNQIAAKQLLLLGLGDPEEISDDLFYSVGYSAVMEALKLDVKDFCFAPSLKDAGIDMSLKNINVAKNLMQGMIRATDDATFLSQKKLIKPVVLTEVKLLAGEAQAENSYNGIKSAFEK